jgi:hypothetical protein
MGELTLTVMVPTAEGDNQQLQITVKLCANLRCVKSPHGGRRYFVRDEKQKAHLYCDRECKIAWGNKTR